LPNVELLLARGRGVARKTPWALPAATSHDGGVTNGEAEGAATSHDGGVTNGEAEGAAK
jgi:hypothetical protein